MESKANRKNRNRTKRKNNLGNRKGKKKIMNYALGSRVVVNDGPFPETEIATLRYTTPDWMRGNSGNYIWSKAFRINNAFDVDPAGGSGAYAGFDELADVYNKYRVISLAYTIKFANDLDGTIIVVVCPTKDDKGSNYASLMELTELPLEKSDLLSGRNGVNTRKFKGVINCAEFVGTKAYYTDDLYAAATTAGPANVLYLNVGFNSYDAQTDASVGVYVKFKATIQFYERKPVEDVFKEMKFKAEKEARQEFLSALKTHCVSPAIG